MNPAYRTGHTQGDAPPVVVEVRDLVAAYDEEVVLRVDALSLHARTVYGLIGPNGAGKSTLLRCLAGLHPPTRGAVRVAGVDLAQTEPARWPRVGFMPDATPAWEKLTCEAWLRLWARGARTTAAEALARVGLAGHEARLTGALSLGMRQRLGLARLLLLDAPLVLLDEPANGMDPDGRQTLAAVLRAEAARGAAVVVSSHVLHELDAVCDRFVMIEGGRLFAEGTALEIDGAAGGVTVRVEVTEATPEVRDALRAALAGVEAVALERWEGDAAVLRCDGGRRRRADILRTLVSRGVPVCGITEDRPHIASVYARLTRKEDPP